MYKLLRNRNLWLILIAGIFLTASLNGCLPLRSSISHPWAAALRALDPADTATPAHDITAVYLRPSGDTLQIRIDLLNFQNPKDLSIDLQIESDSAPQTPPLIIHIPSSTESTRVSLDPLLATVIVEIPFSTIPSRPRVNVSTPEDKITGLTLDGPVPTQTVPLLLTFYETFAGRFPAEALRSWDGAHTGPRGERHGLKHLLDAVEQYRIPIVLLDLKEPENLSALDAMGVLPHVQQMEQKGTLILPGQPGQKMLFGFSPSQFLWGGIPFQGNFPSRPTFVLSSDPSHIYQPIFSKTTIIPIATETDSNQPTPDGPSLEVRRALLATAINNDKKDLLVLGGSLRDTTWGSPDMVGATLTYFASRPYIRVLTETDLINFPAKPGKPKILPFPINDDDEKLKTHYQNLIQPVLDFANSWNGSSLSNCDNDIDQDGQCECVLANHTYLSILDPQGARLTYLFAVGRIDNPPETRITNSRHELHQLIGPSWQVAVGLSNPSAWDTSVGEAADPGAYPGAFADVDDPFRLYEASIDGNVIMFTSLDGKRIKTFTLTDTGIEVVYQTKSPVMTQISLLVDPDSRFTSGWEENYVQENTPGGVAWGLENGPMVSVQFEGLITMRAFNESLSLLTSPEDPDFDYPPGHTIPFPMAILDVEINGNYFLFIERK